ncbi:unnamed protein product [Fusarium langsethiae]|nr:unnamed protein product [Fusarium langsethiae]
MSRSCTDCQIILHAIDQIFSDGLNNKPDSDPLSPFTTGRFTSGLKGWEKAATEGTCALCKTTYFCHSTEKTKEVHDEIERNDPFLWELSGACFDGWVRLALYTDRGGWIGTNPIFQKLSMTREEAHQLEALGGHAGTSTWGPRAAWSLRDWLEGCITSHDECQTLPNSSLPIRLVDVIPSGAGPKPPAPTDHINALSVDAMPHVKILPTAGLSKDTRYLTLSHCWGKSVPIKLLNETRALYEKQIPIEDLLKTDAKVFREAIWVTRCLGYQYLWIDALCINQEDGDEKATEVARMDQIYSGGAANLSATSVSCGAEGMIFTREDNLYELFPCDWKMVEMGQEKNDYLVAYVDENELGEEPTNKRAWVFQERILAPRVIHFCKNKIFRECSKEQMDELQDYVPWINIPKQASQAHVNLDLYKGFDGLEEEQILYHQFRCRLELYSRSALTFPQDRLPSVAGISKAIGRYMGLGEDQYFAGLWKNDLPKALLWQTDYTLGNRNWDPEHAGYISPSWSWAGCEALDIRHKLDTPPFEDLVQITNIWTVPSTSRGSRFGKVSDGGLTLKGRLFEIHRKRIGDGFLISIQDGDVDLRDELYFESRSIQTTRETAESPEGSLKEVNIYWDRYAKDRERVSLPLWQVDASLDSVPWDAVDPEILYFLPISQFQYEERARTRIPMAGLVLQRENKTGRYARVGLFDTEAPKWHGSNHELRMRLLKGRMVELTII